MEATLAIAGMHCSACVAKIDRALRALPGVEDVQVTLDPPRARLRSREPLASTRIEAALKTAGAYLLADQQPASEPSRSDSATKGSLYPLFLILAYLAGTVGLLAWGRAAAPRWETLMMWFMGGFFLVFSFFKLLDLRGFADSYRSYDLLARAVPLWGYAYPFVELALGLAYLCAWRPRITNTATLVFMLIGSAGVLTALLRKRQIRCACLGAVLKLPLTQVSLVEDLAMAAMAALMLVSH